MLTNQDIIQVGDLQKFWRLQTRFMMLPKLLFPKYKSPIYKQTVKWWGGIWKQDKHLQRNVRLWKICISLKKIFWLKVSRYLYLLFFVLFLWYLSITSFVTWLQYYKIIKFFFTNDLLSPVLDTLILAMIPPVVAQVNSYSHFIVHTRLEWASASIFKSWAQKLSTLDFQPGNLYTCFSR